MYELLTFLSGIILAIMIQFNGALSEQFGAYHSSLYVHIVGSVFAFCLLLIKKDLPTFNKKLPFWMYLGGMIGVLTTVFNNLAFSHISLTAIVALGLFGQLVLSCFIDLFGLFGMEKHKQELNLPCIFLSLIGITLMLYNTTSDGFIYIIISLCAGITVVLSRTVNAHLSAQTNALQASLINHLTGLPICLILALIIPEQSISYPFRLWIWCGGILGVITVTIFNITVPKLPAYRLTLLSLCGQIFCGVILDLLSKDTLNTVEFLAGILIASGIIINQLLKSYHHKKKTD